MTLKDQDVTTESTEVEQLRAEVARLQAELDSSAHPPAEAPPRRPSRWRWVGAGVLFLVVALLAPLAIVATWVHDEVSDTDRYVETVAPLASDPAVQNAAIDKITNAIYTRLNVQAVTKEAIDALSSQGLPPRVTTSLNALSTPLANGVRSFIENAVTRLIRSPQFQEAWVAANREAHAELVAVLTGKGGDTIQVQGDTVSVNLAAVIDAVKTRLTDAGFSLASRIPEVNASFPIMQTADISKAQTGFRVLSALARTLPILALLLLGAAVLLAPARRKALVIGGVVVAASMLLLGALLNGFRIVYLDAVPADVLPQDAAAAIYDQLVSFIRLNLRAVLVLFLALAAVAWVTGPWAPAVATRRATNRAVDAVRGGSDRAGLNTGAFGAALYNLRTPIRIGVLALVVLVYVMAAHPTGAFTIVLLLIAALVLLVTELLARPPAAATE
ncbi:MAG: hypothetical protein HOQ45_13185 [Nocardioidaceae bacterium]|nr:hypothetical protein [Nocardioidaceae bacterium]